MIGVKQLNGYSDTAADLLGEELSGWSFGIEMDIRGSTRLVQCVASFVLFSHPEILKHK
jgi:hypothetical protein